MSLLLESDFIGVYKISTDNFSEFQNYIDQYEQMYIRAIVGDENASNMTVLGSLDQKYLDLWNGVNYTGFSDQFTINSGLKKALMGFIYFHYISDNFTNTNVGNVINSNENSSNTENTVNGQIATNRFNSSVTQVRNDINNFLSFYNTIESISTGYAILSPTSYKILIPSTKYLQANSVITINDIEYTVTSIDDNVSVNFIAPAGSDFTGATVIWYPFYQSIINNLEMIVI